MGAFLADRRFDFGAWIGGFFRFGAQRPVTVGSAVRLSVGLSDIGVMAVLVAVG